MFLFGFVLTLFVWLSYADWTSVPCTSPRWSTTGQTSWIAGDSTCGSTQLLSVDPDTGAQMELMFNGDGLQLCGGMDGDATAQIFLDNVRHENSIQTSGGPQCTYLATWSGLSPNTGHNLTIVVPSYPIMGYPTGTGMGFALDRALISTPDDEPVSSSLTTPVSSIVTSIPTMSPATPAPVAPETATPSASSTASQDTSSPATTTSTTSTTVVASSAKDLATPSTTTTASPTRGEPAVQPSFSPPVSRGAIIGASIASGIFVIILVAVAIWLARRYRSKGQPIVYELTPAQTSGTPTPVKAWLSEKGQPHPEASTAATSPSNENVSQGENAHIWTALARLQGEVHALRGGNEEPVPSYVSSPGTHRIQ